jgi:WD40 repeat protein
LFFGGDGKLMQWSVSQKKVTKEYGGIMAGCISSMVLTSGKNYLFLSDNDGCLKKLDVKKQKVVRDYGKIHGQILSIAITSDDKYIFTSDFDDTGHVKQISVRHGQMIKDPGAIFENY